MFLLTELRPNVVVEDEKRLSRSTRILLLFYFCHMKLKSDCEFDSHKIGHEFSHLRERERERERECVCGIEREREKEWNCYHSSLPFLLSPKMSPCFSGILYWFREVGGGDFSSCIIYRERPYILYLLVYKWILWPLINRHKIINLLYGILLKSTVVP